MLALAATAILALGVPGDHAAATYSGSTLALALRYEMICGQPGPGPLVVRLPARFRLVAPRALVNGIDRARAVNDSTVTIDLPRRPGVTCMSIAEGTATVRLTGVHAPRGRWTIRATLHRHAFAARLHVQGGS